MNEAWDEGMIMANVVNLDALLPREDFLASDGADAGSQGKPSISETDLRKGELFLSTLRKPDFQRETAAWTPETICDFVEAFIEGELIPAVICWQSPSRLSFVIDGAHRISAIIAWLRNDYGDGDASIEFYGNNIPAEQRRLAKRTRDMLNARVGLYSDIRAALERPGTNPPMEMKGRLLAQALIPLLWIKGSDSKKAEKAFLTINQKATVIDPTELKILNDRFKPNAIVSRSIVRNATGYKYWAQFSEEARDKIEKNAREIYHLLYKPDLSKPIKNIDLPVAGHGYGSQTLPLIFDLVNIANGFPVIDSSKSKGKKLVLSEHETPSEQDTIKAMANSVKYARMITGDHPSSLGLHPAVYFYSANGRHQPTSVLAMAQFLRDLHDNDELIKFCEYRKEFEDFLIERKMYINQLTAKYGSMSKGYRQVRDYFRYVFDAVAARKSADEVDDLLRAHDRFQILVKEKPILSEQAKAFSTNAAQYKAISDSLAGALTCGVCRGKIDNKSMQLDHIDEKHRGGVATIDNSQWAHPYCNSTYKNYLTRSS